MATKSKSAPTKKPVAKKPAAKKPAVKKTAAKKPAATKTTKVTTKAKAPAKKTTTTAKAPVKAAKKPAAKAKAPAKKTTVKTPAKAVKKPATTSKTAPTTKAPAKKPAATTTKVVSIKVAAKKTSKKSPTDAKSPVVSPIKTTEVPMSNVLDVRELDFAPYTLGDTEEYMNATQLEHFRKILLGWKQVLMEQVDATVSHMQNEPGNLADPNDCATREEEFNLELRTRDRERQLIKKIESTLQQIKQNEYGYCTQCGEEIGVRRLEARPTANLCIDCKTLAEIREKHYSN